MKTAPEETVPAVVSSDPPKPRYERKLIVPAKHDAAECWVRQLPLVFRRAYPPRWVNNLYFDTQAYRHYRENIAGLASRKKVRIRWYGELEATLAPVLEFKIKAGLCGYKDQLALTAFDFPGRLSGYLSEHPRVVAKDGAAICGGETLPPAIRAEMRDLYPVLLNRYRRRYFEAVGGRLRLTLDDSLHFFALKGNRRVSGPAAEGLILELKYEPGDEDLARQVCQAVPYRLARHSKYVRGLEELLRRGAYLP